MVLSMCHSITLDPVYAKDQWMKILKWFSFKCLSEILILYFLQFSQLSYFSKTFILGSMTWNTKGNVRKVMPWHLIYWCI